MKKLAEINKEKEDKKCSCNNECTCGENCTCDSEHKCSENCHWGENGQERKHNRHCGEDCKCGDECHCEGDCHCESNEACCGCGENCECDDECDCNKSCHCAGSKEEEYLNLARQIQADFENFRRRALDEVKTSRINGQTSVIEVFLPCLDTFKEAKKMISDESSLQGVEMIEKKIMEALTSLGVEKISSIGEKYNPHLHNVIAVMKDEEKENDVILDEYQAGYKFNDKVIRYSKVIVNKKED